MALQYDATLKDLFRQYLADWLAGLGVPDPAPEVLTPDLSTLTAFADVVVRLRRRLLHLDFQSGPDPLLDRRMLLYNAALYHQYGLPVHTVVLLLHRRADRRGLTGRVQYEGRAGFGAMGFTFEVVRVWERPVEGLLTGPLGMAPLAVLARLPGARAARALPGVVARLEERIRRELPKPQANQLLTAAFVLSGLRVSDAVALRLFERVQGMKESTTYQYILNEGELRHAHRVLLSQGQARFGSPDEETEAAIQAISDLRRLDRMALRILTASTWQELLATR